MYTPDGCAIRAFAERLDDALGACAAPSARFVLSLRPDARPWSQCVAALTLQSVRLISGPEGGLSPLEEQRAIEAVRQVAATVEQKAPLEATAFKGWLLKIASRVPKRQRKAGSWELAACR